MMLVPWNSDRGHAVREAAVQISLARPINSSALTTIATDLYPRLLRSELPKLERTASPIFSPEMLLNQPSGVAVPLPMANSGVAMLSFQPNGEIGWRLLVDQNGIAVNCLSYGTWDEYLSRILNYAELVLDVLQDDAPLITGVALQYINSFGIQPKTHWATAWPQVEATFRLDNPEMPRVLAEKKSPEMHVNLGYFTPGRDNTSRTLHRHSLASSADGNAFSYLLDLYQQMAFSQGNHLTRGQLLADLADILNYLRVENRIALRNFVGDEMLSAIGAVELKHA